MKVSASFTPVWERWEDPGPAICGAGARVPGFTYLAEIDGACVITWEAGEPVPRFSTLCAIAQEECPYATVTKWAGRLSGELRRATLTAEDFDEATACKPEDFDDGPDPDDLYDRWRNGD